MENILFWVGFKFDNDEIMTNYKIFVLIIVFCKLFSDQKHYDFYIKSPENVRYYTKVRFAEIQKNSDLIEDYELYMQKKDEMNLSKHNDSANKKSIKNKLDLEDEPHLQELLKKKDLIEEYLLRYPRLVGSMIYTKSKQVMNFMIGEVSICLLMITAYYSGNVLSIVYFLFSIYFSSCADILS